MSAKQFCTDDFETPTAKYKSNVWKHFKFPVYYEDGQDRVRKVCYEKTVCDICKAFLTYSGNTTNMSTHLKRHHPSIAVQQEKSSTPPPKKSCKQAKQTTLGNFTKLAMNSERNKQITRRIAVYICHDLRPFSTVENQAFLDMIHELEPRYDIPGRTYFTTKVIPELYSQCKAQLEKELAAAPAVAITSDGWTSRAVVSYITITVHYISQDWKLISSVLQTNPIYESHTGHNVGEVLSTAVKDWKLEREMPVACVTDNAANMIVAVKEAGMTHVKCFAHTLNLASQHGLKLASVSRLLGRIRRVVAFFHRSTTANALLKEKQLMLQLPKHKLIQDVSTRWNSSFEMVERYLEQQPAVLSVLMCKEIRKTEKDLGLSETDLSNAEDLVAVLKPLKTITTILCDARHPTISLIFPMKQQILTLMKVQETDSGFVRSVKEAVIGDISSRYTNEEDFLLLTSAIDPRFRSLAQIDDERKLVVFSSLITKTSALELNSDKVQVKQEPTEKVHDEPGLPQLPDPETEQKKQEPNMTKVKRLKTSAMEDIFGDVFITYEQPAKSILVRAEEEVNTYKGEECIPLTADPLQWWCENEQRFPLLSKVARCLLCIPGTSVPSERVFSTAGDIVTAQRSQLKPENVNMLIFLKKNFSLNLHTC